MAWLTSLTPLQWIVIAIAVAAVTFGFWRRISLTRWILLTMAVGALIGWQFPELSQNLRVLSTIFLRMIKSIVAPIIFATLVMGIAGHGDDMRRVGRLALKSIIYFEVVTTIALFIGLAAVNLTKPGVGIRLSASAQAGQQLAQTRPTASQFLEHIVPTSILDAMAKNEVLQIVFWSILFAIGLSQVRGRPKEVMLGALEGLAETVFKMVGVIMKYAPIGIGAAIALVMPGTTSKGTPAAASIPRSCARRGRPARASSAPRPASSSARTIPSPGATGRSTSTNSVAALCVCSTMSTASEPGGSGAPVAIATAIPGRTSTCGGRPMRASPANSR